MKREWKIGEFKKCIFRNITILFHKKRTYLWGMNEISYSYRRICATRYVFVSKGRRIIKKIVEFAAIGADNTYNLGFGDMLPDGSMDDRINSNNGDIGKVLSTVIYILKDFTSEYRDAVIFFTGNSPKRMHLYIRILRMYYAVFLKEFMITAITGRSHNFIEIPFDPQVDMEYSAFLVKRNSWHDE